jgi:hypothetical protein
MKQSSIRLMVVLCAALLIGAEFVAAQSSQAPPLPNKPAHTLKGEVVMITNELIILKEPTGNRSLIQVGKEIQKDATVKEGTQVEIAVTEDGQAKTITILKNDPKP